MNSDSTDPVAGNTPAAGAPLFSPATALPLAEESYPREEGQLWHMAADVEGLSGQIKRAIVTTSDQGATFEIFCDEPPVLGGTNAYPQPLLYVSAGIGFCLLTQLGRYATILKLTVKSAKCRIEFDWFLEGSVRRGSVRSGAREARVHLDIDSDESLEDISKLIHLAKRGCFAEQMVEQPVPVRSTFTLNGANWLLPNTAD